MCNSESCEGCNELIIGYEHLAKCNCQNSVFCAVGNQVRFDDEFDIV